MAQIAPYQNTTHINFLTVCETASPGYPIAKEADIDLLYIFDPSK
jgi:hypothetical protein